MAVPIYTLRDADLSDLEFLFGIFAAMREPAFDWGVEFRKFKKRFEPGKVQIIQHHNADIGRLRIVRDCRAIYVGGIHLLPAYQRRGIGSAIFAELINESGRTGRPITLEVHTTNFEAQRFYERLEFIPIGLETRAKTGRFWQLARFPH